MIGCMNETGIHIFSGNTCINCNYIKGTESDRRWCTFCQHQHTVRCQHPIATFFLGFIPRVKTCNCNKIEELTKSINQLERKEN